MAKNFSPRLRFQCILCNEQEALNSRTCHVKVINLVTNYQTHASSTRRIVNMNTYIGEWFPHKGRQLCQFQATSISFINQTVAMCSLFIHKGGHIRKAKHLSPPWFFLLFLTLISPDSRRRRTKKSRQGHTGGKKIQYLIRLCALIMFVLQYPLCVTEWRQLCRLADCFCFPFSPPLLSWWLFAWCARGKLLNIHFDGTAEKARDLHESHDDSISLWRSFHDFSRNSADAQMDDN